jgi:Uri superfamily endonuclease
MADTTEIAGRCNWVTPAGAMGSEQGRLPGIYVLLFRLAEEIEVAVGRLGSVRFPSGWYGYVGSGMAGVRMRVRRHLRPHDRPHWHLDYLLPHGIPSAVVTAQTSTPLECSLAGALGLRFQVFSRFGSSDCRCPGHLFHSRQIAPLADAALDGMKGLGCSPTITTVSSELSQDRTPPP